MMKAYWAIVAFNHPTKGKSLLYRQKLTFVQLQKAIEKAYELGANLMSIRMYYVEDAD